MFGKNWSSRWDDTIKYLNNKFARDRLGDHINSVVPLGSRKAISTQLSLGSRSDGEDDPGYKGTTDQRHALRGLMLCQRVYYSGDLWAKQSEAGQGLNVVPLLGLLAADWKTQSLNHWRQKSEQQILSGIGMFVPVVGATRENLQTAAFDGPPNGTVLPGNLTLSRDEHVTKGFGVICYVGVQGWLVRSGLVSMRWFMQNSAPNKEVGCDLLFGKGEEVWRGAIKPEDKDRVLRVINDIGPGYVVHIWSPQNYNWNGHWVITNGDGTICGVNNGEVEGKRPVQKNYTNHSTLFEQFEGYGEQLDEKDVTKGYRTAVMAVIDPLQMPNRI